MTIPFINLDDNRAVLEIARICYTGCPWCYKQELVGPRGTYVPLEILKRRIDWISDNTTCTELSLAGGEPVLHPELRQICEYIEEKEMEASPITSCKAPPSLQGNLDYLVEMYKAQKIFPQISYQPGRNDEEVRALIGRLHQARKENPLPKKDEDHIDLFTTLVLRVDDLSVYKNMMRYLIGYILGIETKGMSIKHGEESVSLEKSLSLDLTEYGRNHSTHWWKRSDSVRSYQLGVDDAFRVQIRLLPEVVITDMPGYTIIRPTNYQGPCAGMKSGWHDRQKRIDLDGLMVTTEGQATFSAPQCIRARHMFGNIDELDSPDKAYDSFKSGLKWIKKAVILTKARHASGNEGLCQRDRNYPRGDDGKPKEGECSGCDSPMACNICVNEDRDEVQDPDDLTDLIGRWQPVVEDQY